MFTSVVLEKHRVKLPAIDKFVDGASVAQVGRITYDVAQQVVDEYLQIDEGAVCSTILDMYSKQAIIAELLVH